ncbi:MAG: Trk family potassium uptake protein [Lachnospiraceae bacterium]|nr:Trk family potassium uptake protein [Lachnospiraceae bacterium]
MPHMKEKISSFQIIIFGFLAVILAGTLLLMLPISSAAGVWTHFADAMFTSVSAVCVTGLVIFDTATRWSAFGQAVILLLIQIGGLGVVSVTAMIAIVSGRKISLLQRSLLQESISANQIGGLVRMTGFIFKFAFTAELLGAVLMLPAFMKDHGVSGIWMAVFHSVSAFCNAGFDVMGRTSGAFSSLTHYSAHLGVVIPVCLLIVTGGIGFLTWDDCAAHRLQLKRYLMQSKVILTTTLLLIVLPAVLFFVRDFADHPLKERLCLSLFQAVTPRTAGFNTTGLNVMSAGSRMVMIFLMLIGGSPGSTAGGMKTTTVAVLFANAVAVVNKKKNACLFGRRIEDATVKNAATLLVMYLFLFLAGALIISASDNLPLFSCLFETASAIGTVGLSLGITPQLGMLSKAVLMILMFFGRVGGLTLLFAALNSKGVEVSLRPVEKINVG